MRNLLLALAICLVAGFAIADDKWMTNADGTGSELKALSPGEGWFSSSVAHWYYNTATVDANVLDVSRCGTWTALFNPDVSTTAIYDSATVKIRTCNDGTRGAAADPNFCAYQYNTAGAVPLTGDPSTGLHKIMGSNDSLIAAESIANASNDWALLTIQCNK